MTDTAPTEGTTPPGPPAGGCAPPAAITRTTRTTPAWQGSGVGFTGLGHYFPRTLVDNSAGTEATSNSLEDKLLGDLGVLTRYRSDEEETVQYMAVRAAERALADAGLTADDIDLVILSNWTDRLYGPEIAPRIASDLGMSGVLAFDVCAGCAGFVMGVQTAALHLTGPMGIRRALVISSERFSRRVRPGSKGELVTGDAAGAAVVEISGTEGRGLIDSQLSTDGTRHHLTGAYPPHGWVRSSPDLIEEAIAHATTVTREILGRNGLTVADLDWFVPHSGTSPIMDGIQKELGLAPERFASNFRVRGNLSSASIPTVLSEFTADGQITPGNLVLAPAVGGGWFYGALLFRA